MGNIDMGTYQVNLNNSSIESSGIPTDYKVALSEYIWNSFEANASQVSITYNTDTCGLVNSIIIQDNGDGISYDELNSTFGAFLSSTKDNFITKIKSKSNKGKGRYSFLCFSSIAKWETVYISGNKFYTYAISMSSEDKTKFEVSDLLEIKKTATGTKVILYNIEKLYNNDFQNQDFQNYLLQQFSWYLYLKRNNNYRLSINDITLDYNSYVNGELSLFIEKKIDIYTFNIDIIVWNDQIKETSRLYFIDDTEKNVCAKPTNFNKNSAKFSHSVFITSSFFENFNLEAIESTELNFLANDDQKKIFSQLMSYLKKSIAERLNEYLRRKADMLVMKMQKNNTFPHFPDDEYGALRKKDLSNVVREIYVIEPGIFHNLKPLQEKTLLEFLNLLLDSEERENVLEIIENITELSKEQRDDLAEILRKTSLSNIIDTIKFIDRRFEVIESLKKIVFDLDNYSNERNHIQKIIENNYWIFGEEYNLVSADQPFEKLLKQYLYVIDNNADINDYKIENQESLRRPDIFICRNNGIYNNSTILQENIIVELKAPNVVLTKTVTRQIEDYMDLISHEPKFTSSIRSWKFICICRKIDARVLDNYTTFKNKNKPFLIFEKHNFEIYAMTWDDVFVAFELRHKFILDKLQLDKQKIIDKINEEYPDKNRETVDKLVANLI